MFLFQSDKNSGCYVNIYYISYRLIIGKAKTDILFCLNGDIWNLFLQKCLLSIFLQKCLFSSPLRFIWLLSKSLNLIAYQCDKSVDF